MRRGSKAGSSAAEYALIVSVVGLAIVAAGLALGNSIVGTFTTFVADLNLWRG